MPIYTIQGPDGRKYRIEGPEGATADQLAAFVQSQPEAKPTAAPQPEKIDPTEGMSGLDKFRAGMGKAFVDTGRGIGQLFGLVDRKDIDEARQLDKALMDTGAGMAGNIAGNVAQFAPVALVPGANTVAGGALAGAVTGAIQPVGEGDSRIANAAVGGVAGGVVPAAVRAGKAAKAALVDPFTEAGRTRIAGGVINRAVADPKAVAQQLAQAKGATPGFNPTAAQAADDAGLAALERATQAANPGAFNEVQMSQRQALADALRGIARDPAARQAALDVREGAAQSLYGKAFDSDAMRRSLANSETTSAAMNMASGIHQQAPFAAKGIATDMATPGLRDLSNRPMFQAAIQQAKTLAANKGVQLDDPLQSLQGLHYIKLALDDMANPQAATAMGRNAAASVNDMRSLLTNELAQVSPTYGAARQTYADLSKPINQMDIGQEFYQRLVPGLYRDMDAPATMNAQAFARALADQGDDIARNVTKMKGATLQGVMTPEQMGTLRGVASDLQRMKVAETAGRGVGSDTVQKTAMSHLAAEAGIPNWMASVARVPGGMLKRAGDAIYGSSDDQVRQMMANLLQNPQEAAKAMQAAGVDPSVMSIMLQRGAQGLGLSALPAGMD